MDGNTDLPRDDFEGDPGFAGGLLADGTPAFPAEEFGAPAMLPGDEPEQEAPAATEDEQVERDIRDLIQRGYITSSFKFIGHDFVLRTLLSGEELAAAEVTKRWEGTLGEGKAHQMAIVGTAIVTMNGEPLTRPVGPGVDEVTIAASRNFHYLARKFAYPIIEVLYIHYGHLKIRENDALVALEGKSEAGLPTT